MIAGLRAVARLAALAGAIGWSLGEFLVRRCGRDAVRRADWMRRVAARLLRAVGCRVIVAGAPPKDGLLVANHLGYLDILVLGSLGRMVFVAKSEVARWPVFGLLARLSGTIFVDRTRRHGVNAPRAAMEAALSAGLPVALFPEGTSSDGTSVLPFRSSLLETTAETVTAAALSYRRSDGRPAPEAAYWGDAVFGWHLLHLLARPPITAEVCFGNPGAPSGDRKADAIRWRAAVEGLTLKEEQEASARS